MDVGKDESDNDVVPVLAVGELCCCLAIVDTALRKSGELMDIPGISE